MKHILYFYIDALKALSHQLCVSSPHCVLRGYRAFPLIGLLENKIGSSLYLSDERQPNPATTGCRAPLFSLSSPARCDTDLILRTISCLLCPLLLQQSINYPHRANSAPFRSFRPNSTLHVNSHNFCLNSFGTL